MKKCFITRQLGSIINRRRSSAGGSFTSTTGAVTSLILMVALSLLSSVAGIGTVNTYATDSISLTVSDTLVSFDLTPTSTSGTFSSSSDIDVDVALSGVGGYTLTIRSNNTSKPTDLINSSDNTKTISTLERAVSGSDFSSSSTYNNKWGYKPSKLNSSDNTNYLPSPSLEGDILDKTSGTNDEGFYTISIASRVDMDTAPGTYSNTFVIAAIANSTCNPNATGILEAVCMQDMNDEVANSMVVGKQYQLVDNRDNTVYYVAKMKDGRVWMTQNLDLNLETAPDQVAALTSDNTDINESDSGAYVTGYTTSGDVITWTPANATGIGWTYDDNVPYSYENGDKYYYTDTSGNTTTYDSKAECEASHDDGTCNHYHSGNYYNFSAAVASNDTSSVTSGVMSNSICPKGWRLPNNSSQYGDVNRTWLAEGITTGIVTAAEHYGIYGSNGYNRISNAPLYLVRSGYRDNGSTPKNTGSYGYFRTGQLNDATYAWTYYFTPVYPYPYERYATTNRIWFTRAYEAPVRCLARQSNTGGSTTITFSANGGAGTIANQTITAGGSATLTNNAFTRQNYVFTGWNTESDGSGVTYDNQATYYAAVGTLPVNTTLYAQWAPAHSMTVNADTNIGAEVSTDGGSTWVNAPTTVTVGEGTTILLKATDSTEGTVFDNWTKDSGVGDFVTTVWRNSNNKTAAFIVGAGDATVTANGTTTYTTIGSTTVNMQDVTACPDWLTTGTMYQVTDTRDNDTYSVAKLADGKCWMLENLRLGSNDNAIDLTPADTNIAENWTLLKGITSGFSSFTAKQINAAYKDDVAPTKYGDASGKVGTYYNYCAASAGEVCTAGDDAVNTTHDICPVGWRMPAGGYEDKKTGFGEYYSLYYAYGSNQANYKAALSVPLSGYFNYATQYNLGSSSYFWSSTFYGGLYSYRLGANSGDVVPVNYDGHDLGFSVRCLLSD